MKSAKIEKGINGIINIPGDKSISHRALMLASLTDGNCVINNISTGDDVETTRKCLAECGIVSKKNGTTILLKGRALQSPNIPLNCGNSGTTVRLLAGLLAGSGITEKFIGDKSLLLSVLINNLIPHSLNCWIFVRV